MPRQQINIKLPPELIEVLREKASTEEITLTELIQRFCEQGLGLAPSNYQAVDIELVYERISTELDERISVQLDRRISDTQAFLLSQLDERISNVVYNRIADSQKQLEVKIEDADKLATVSAFVDATTALDESIESAASSVSESAIVEEAITPVEVEHIVGDRNTLKYPLFPVLEEAITSNSDNSEPTATSDADTSPPRPQKGITATALIKRLGLKAASSVTRRPERESEEGFKNWTKKRDPDGIAWIPRESSDTDKRVKILYFPCADSLA